MAQRVHVVDGFRRGEVLTADALNSMEARVAVLRQRVAHLVAGGRTLVREPEGFRFGFQCCVLLGVVLVRCGLIDWGCGEFERVGGEDGRTEWLPVGAFELGRTVWLEMERGESRVVMEKSRAGEVSSALRRRLAVVQEHAEVGLRLLQLTGGVMTPALIRGMAGSPNFWHGHADGKYYVSAEDDGRQSEGWMSAGILDWSVTQEEKVNRTELSYAVTEPGLHGAEYADGKGVRPVRYLQGLLQA